MSAGKSTVATERHGFARGQSGDEGFARDVRAGLAATPKRLPSKYFYDARGSELFEAICEQPEYYLTRTELDILDRHAEAVAAAVGPRTQVLEYGSGSGIKTRLLLAALDDPVAYAPVEISRSALDESVRALASDFPAVEMLPVCADFTQAVALPHPRREPASVLVFFPGSTLGNFCHDDAVALLRVMHSEMGDSGAALVGVDLQKQRATMEAAYNDAAGVTAAFTLNLLERMNRELGADFDPDAFTHRARYIESAGRIETCIVSRCEQWVEVAGQRVHFAEGEALQVEYSHKYTLEGVRDMAAAAGLRVTDVWTDDDDAFALVLLRRQSA